MIWKLGVELGDLMGNFFPETSNPVLWSNFFSLSTWNLKIMKTCAPPSQPSWSFRQFLPGQSMGPILPLGNSFLFSFTPSWTSWWLGPILPLSFLPLQSIYQLDHSNDMGQFLPQAFLTSWHSPCTILDNFHSSLLQPSRLIRTSWLLIYQKIVEE